MKSGALGFDLASVEALRTYIPALFFLACTCVVWFFRLLYVWKPTRTLLDFLSRPFRPFLTLDDVAEYDSSIEPTEVPSIERKSLRILCFIQAAGWIFWSVLCGINGAWVTELLGTALMGLSWVGSCFLSVARLI